MIRMFMTVGATAVTFAAVVASCGDDSGGSSSLPAGGATQDASAGATTSGRFFGDPCSVLSTAEVRLVIPDAKPGVVTVKSPAAAACAWDSAATAGKRLTLIMTRSTVGDGRAGVATAFANAGDKGKNVDVGDGGVFTGAGVGFFKGEVGVQLILTGDGPVQEGALVGLATKVAAKL